ncbi:MAG: CDP-alcohol phosphatidyltransferase family protein [Acidobacteria bacterium]|nr:CDP-alcohol phosphatidyltransferase family protein [Acidobacteriota bacterium]
MASQWTHANQLTILRMAMIPLFVLLIVYRYFDYGLLVFVVAGVSDALDGLIARRFGQKTALGAFLDPMADKLLLTAAFIVFSFGSLDLPVRIPLWLTIAAISRDVLIVLTVLLINLTSGRRVFPPTLLGKLTTLMQVGVVVAALAGNTLGYAVPQYRAILGTAFGFTVASGLHYLLRTMKTLNMQQDIKV